MQTMLSFAKRYPYACLLAVQLTSVLFYGMMTDSQLSHAMFHTIALAVPILAVWVVFRTPAINWIAYILAGLAVALTLATNFLKLTHLTVWAQSCESLLYFYAALSLVMHMFRDDIVTRDELYAAAATFTLLAWGFALAYSVCQLVYPGSITAAVNPSAPRTWMELLFMSFSIQSSTGVGDVIPISPQARAIGSLQIFTGVMYIAIIVSRLVGLAGNGKTKA